MNLFIKMMIHTIYTCISYTGSKENHIFFSKSTRVIACTNLNEQITMMPSLGPFGQAFCRKNIKIWKVKRTTDRRWMPSDEKSSHGLWPGEITKNKTFLHPLLYDSLQKNQQLLIIYKSFYHLEIYFTSKIIITICQS